MVFFCRPGRMSLRALLTGFLVGAGVVCAVVCAAAAAASNNKAGIKSVFFILFSWCGEKHSAGGRVRASLTESKVPEPSSTCLWGGGAFAPPVRGAAPSPHGQDQHRQPCAILIT